MNNCRAVAFFNEDLDLIDPVFAVHGVDRGFFKEDHAYTIMIDDVPVGSVGIHKVFDGVGILWGVVDKNIPENFKFKVARICRRVLYLQMEKYNFHRVQADIQCDIDVCHKFVKMLGLKSEGLMKAFGPGKEDYTRYALVRG